MLPIYIMLRKQATGSGGGGLSAYLENDTITGFGSVAESSPASADFILDNDGYAYSIITDEFGTPTQEQLFQWKTGSGSNSDYEAYVTVTSGSLSSGTTGSAVNLGTDRTWNKTRLALGVGTASCTISVSIRKASDSSVLAGPNSITLVAEVGA